MSTNLFIVWSKSYETNIPILDEQHRSLVGTINSLYYLMNEHSKANIIGPTLAVLEHYSDTHFLTEEYLMEVTGYPHLKEHKEEHDKFRAKIARLGVKSAKTLDPRDLLTFFKDWWLEHVRGADHSCESHIRESLIKSGKL